MKFAIKDGQRIAVASPVAPERTLSLAHHALDEQDPDMLDRAVSGPLVFKGWLGIDQRSILDASGEVEPDERIEPGDVLLPEAGILRAPMGQA